MLREMNHSNIVLIPKEESPNSIGQYRPIPAHQPMQCHLQGHFEDFSQPIKKGAPEADIR